MADKKFKDILDVIVKGEESNEILKKPQKSSTIDFKQKVETLKKKISDGIQSKTDFVEKVKTLEETGKLDLDVPLEDSYPTLIFVACRFGLDCVKILLNADQNTIYPNFSRTNSYGYTPLHSACKHGHQDQVKIMLAHSANIGDLRTNIGSHSPLAIAIKFKQYKVARILLDHSCKGIEQKTILIAGAGAVKAANPQKNGLEWIHLTGWDKMLKYCLDQLGDKYEDELAKRLSTIIDNQGPSLNAPFLLSVASYIELSAGTLKGMMEELCKDVIRGDDLLAKAIEERLNKGNAMFATTNYDDLYEINGKSQITHKDYDKGKEFIEGSSEFYLHLHGHWSKPETIILSPTLYNQLATDINHLTQMMLLMSAHKCIFFGMSANGLSDPHMTKVFELYNEITAKEDKHVVCVNPEKTSEFDGFSKFKWLKIHKVAHGQELRDFLKSC